MKLTVVINDRGKVAGTFSHKGLAEGIQVKLVPGPKQSIREIEVPDEFARLEPKDLHERIVRLHLKGKKTTAAAKTSKKR